MNTVVTTPIGNPPLLGNLYVLFSSFLTILIPLALLVLLIWYLKRNYYYQTEKLKIMNQILSLLKEKDIFHKD